MQKKILSALVVLVLLAAGAGYAILRFWPDTTAGAYVAQGWDCTKSWYGTTVEFWTEQWHKIRPPEKAKPAPKPVQKAEPAPQEEEKPEEKKAEEPKKKVEFDQEKPWKGLESKNWYCGKKLTEKSLSGKIVMVYVFSESSEDSVALLPRIEQVWSAYKTKPFIMLGSHRGGKTAKAARLIKKAKVSFPVYEDAGRTKEPGSGGQYPVIYVVDDTGRMIYRGRSDMSATEAVVTAIPEVGKKRRR